MTIRLHRATEKVECYINDIIALHGRLSFRHFSDKIGGEPVWLRRRNTTPLTTVAALESQIPDRYLLGIYGFRLSQYLRLGWACADTVYARSLFAEPHRRSPRDLHVVTLDQHTGHILGYINLARPGAETGKILDDHTRAQFSVEVAHGFWVQDEVPDLANAPYDSIGEIKRFIRDVGLTDKDLCARVPCEVLTGLLRALSAIGPRIEWLVGDLQESVILKYLLKSGMRTRLIEGTSPALPFGDVMQPAYSKRKNVKPFIAEVPTQEHIELLIAAADTLLASGAPFRLSSLAEL
jgi:hypothetical protein